MYMWYTLLAQIILIPTLKPSELNHVVKKCRLCLHSVDLRAELNLPGYLLKVKSSLHTVNCSLTTRFRFDQCIILHACRLHVQKAHQVHGCAFNSPAPRLTEQQTSGEEIGVVQSAGFLSTCMQQLLASRGR